MAQSSEAAQAESFIERFAAFIQRRRKALIFSGVFLFLVLTALVVNLEIKKRTLESSALRLEALEKDYNAWITAHDAAEKPEAEADAAEKASSQAEAVVREAQAVTAEYGDTFAAQKALDIQADIAYRTQDLEKAAEIWTSLAGRYPSSYLAPIALLNAASSWEDAEKPEKAAENLNLILERHSTDFPDIPLVIFSLGRLAEKAQTPEDAKNFYTRLINEYPGSSWTKYAHDRIITLGK
ncbi:MAG: tetratricopeptide repeat protein [Spirochaetales bacterium]|jgi:TolA-binding protein|nr:tetratricopeptide repeat protein [Spirochaetales bacterium]